MRYKAVRRKFVFYHDPFSHVEDACTKRIPNEGIPKCRALLINQNNGVFIRSIFADL